MKVVLYICVITMCIYQTLAKPCKVHQKKLASKFYRELLNHEPNVFFLLTSADDKGVTPEDLITIIDKDGDCMISRDELIHFMEKWAIKKKTTLSDTQRNILGQFMVQLRITNVINACLSLLQRVT